ncbi:hypothetical protein ABT272_43490, partial [Streptomyces sp900105245]
MSNARYIHTTHFTASRRLGTDAVGALGTVLTSACQGEAGAGYEAVEGVGLVLESFEAVAD